VIDDFRWECLALEVYAASSGTRVALELDIAIMERLAKPITGVGENGNELTSTAILK
jgi:putative transposase